MAGQHLAGDLRDSPPRPPWHLRPEAADGGLTRDWADQSSQDLGSGPGAEVHWGWSHQDDPGGRIFAPGNHCLDTSPSLSRGLGTGSGGAGWSCACCGTCGAAASRSETSSERLQPFELEMERKLGHGVYCFICC